MKIKICSEVFIAALSTSYVLGATECAAAPPTVSSQWTFVEYDAPTGVASIVAVGATKDGVIVAQADIGDVSHAFIYLPIARFGIESGWTDLGVALPRSLSFCTVSPSYGTFAAVITGGQSAEFILAEAPTFDACGVGIEITLSQVTSGWLTAVLDSGIAVGAVTRLNADGGTNPMPFRASVGGGLEQLSIPADCTGGVLLDVNSAGWIVGTGLRSIGATAIIGTGITLKSMDGLVRGLGSTRLDSCVSVRDNLSIIANLRREDGSRSIARLDDARADHLIDNEVNIADLGAFIADFVDADSSADVDLSGSVEVIDFDQFVELWSAAQSSSVVLPPIPSSAFRLVELATRVANPNALPTGLRNAARDELRTSIYTKTFGVETIPLAPSPAQNRRCLHKPFNTLPNEHWCGSSDFDVPDLFPQCCANHDNCYRGTPNETSPQPPTSPPLGGREACDSQFFQCMKDQCHDTHSCPFARFGCELVAGTYYLGVRLFGHCAYCECLRGVDLAECGPSPIGNQVGALGSVVLP